MVNINPYIWSIEENFYIICICDTISINTGDGQGVKRGDKFRISEYEYNYKAKGKYDNGYLRLPIGILPKEHFIKLSEFRNNRLESLLNENTNEK